MGADTTFNEIAETNGNLKSYLNGFYRIVADHMLRKSLITEADTVNLRPDIKLTGDAKKYLTVKDTLAVDSLMNEDDF